MAETEYHYDPKTLRFRRAGQPWGKWLVTALAFIGFTGLSFFGAFYLKNELFSGPEESRLRKENAALERHHERLTAELNATATDLQQLNGSSEEIYRQLFLTDKGSGDVAPTPAGEILEIETAEFRKITEEMIKKATMAGNEARLTNAGFGELFWPGKSDAGELKHYPTLPPVPGFEPKDLACGFGHQINPFNKLPYVHSGLDILAERGTPVLASGNGRVAEIGLNQGPGGQGNYIVIDHGNGYRTRYSMLESLLIRYGQQVRQGDKIASIGVSGSSIAPHLHFEVLQKGKAVNPAPFLVQQDAGALTTLLELSRQIKQGLD